MATTVLWNLSFRAISHFPSCFPFNRQLQLRKPVLSLIAYDGNSRGSRPKRTSASGRNNGDETKKLSDGNKAPNSADREEIIALFRRIRSSISKGETGRDKTESLSPSKVKSTVESVLDVLRESRKNVRVTRSRKGGKASRWKRVVPKKTQGTEEKVDPTTPGFELSRPPSNFVKRSPIPYPTAPSGKDLQQESEVVAATNEGLNSANMEYLKLAELKELAKAKGIKGYSRLKKVELVQLLRS